MSTTSIAPVPALAIRYYEETGLLPRPARVSGKRRYDQSVLERLAVLERAKAYGFTLSETRQLFYGFREDSTPSKRCVAASTISNHK